jgi:hypothetical protein
MKKPNTIFVTLVVLMALHFGSVNAQDPNLIVVMPTPGAVSVGFNPKLTAKAVLGATTYTIEISPLSDFSGGVIVKSGARTQTFMGLIYSTKYFVRVKTNLAPDYGVVTDFTVGPPEQFTFMERPVNGSLRVGLNPMIRSTAIVGATT